MAAQPLSFLKCRLALWLKDPKLSQLVLTYQPQLLQQPRKVTQPSPCIKTGMEHYNPLHTSGAQHEAAATSPAEVSLEGHTPAPDNYQQQTRLRDNCQG